MPGGGEFLLITQVFSIPRCTIEIIQPSIDSSELAYYLAFLIYQAAEPPGRTPLEAPCLILTYVEYDDVEL